MNYKITVDQMLKDFSGGFLEFRDAFHKITNDVADYELKRSNNVEANMDVLLTNRLDEIGKEMKKLKKETIDSNLSEEEQKNARDRINFKLKGLEEEKEAIEKEITDYKAQLKDSIVKMRETLGHREVDGKTVTTITTIDIIKNQIDQELQLISFQLANRAADFKLKGIDKEKNRKDIENLVKQREQLIDLKEKLDMFMVEFEKLEAKYVKGNKNVDIFELQEERIVEKNGVETSMTLMEIFEDIANTIDKNVDKNLIVVNIIHNGDGTYSIDMRCGNMIADPRPLITADKFNKKTVSDYVKGFASVVASKSELSMETFEASKVALKENGVDKGRFDFKTFGEDAMKQIANSNDKNQEVKPEEVKPEEIKPEEVKPEEVKPEEVKPEEVKPEEVEPEEVEPEEVEPEEVEPEEVEPEQQNVEDTKENEARRVGDMEDDVVYKVVSARNARRGKYNVAKTVLATAAIGLGFAGTSLGFGLAPAALVGGTFVATTVLEALGDGLTKLRYNATRRKLKKIARKCGVEYEENYENGTAYFALIDDETNELVPITSSNTNGLSDIYNAELTAELNRAFNKTRGKGENPTSFDEITNSNLEPVTIDNVEAAFQEFGGIQTRKELNAYKFSPIKAFNRFKEALKPEGDDLETAELNEVEKKTPLEHVEGEIVNEQDIPTANPEAFDMDDAQAMIDALEKAEEPVVDAPKAEESATEEPAPATEENDEELEALMAALNGNEPVKDMNGVQDYIDVFMSSIDDPTDTKAVSEKLSEYLEQTPELSEIEKMALIDTVNAAVQFETQDYDALVEQARGKELGM